MSRTTKSGGVLEDSTVAALQKLEDDWGTLESAIRGVDGPRPNGSVTIMEYCTKTGMKPRTARDRMDKAVKAGRMKTGLFEMLNRRGELRFIRCYWVVPCNSIGSGGKSKTSRKK